MPEFQISEMTPAQDFLSAVLQVILKKNFISFKGLYPGDIMAENIISAEAAVNIYLNKVLVLSPFYSMLFYQFPDRTKDLYSFGTFICSNYSHRSDRGSCGKS